VGRRDGMTGGQGKRGQGGGALRRGMRWRPRAPPPLAWARTSPKTAGGGLGTPMGSRSTTSIELASARGPLPRPLPARSSRRGENSIPLSGHRSAPGAGRRLYPLPLAGEGGEVTSRVRASADAAKYPSPLPEPAETPTSPGSFGGGASPGERRGRRVAPPLRPLTIPYSLFPIPYSLSVSPPAARRRRRPAWRPRPRGRSRRGAGPGCDCWRADRRCGWSAAPSTSWSPGPPTARCR
jgi:hypothetical protein